MIAASRCAALIERKVCGFDLRTAPTRRCPAKVLAAQAWVQEQLDLAAGDDLSSSTSPIHASAAVGEQTRDARALLADLPTLVAWVLRVSLDEDFAGLGVAVEQSWVRHQERVEGWRNRGWRRPDDAPLSGAAAVVASRMLGPDEEAARSEIGRLCQRWVRPYRMTPPLLLHATWDRLQGEFPRRYLQLADPDIDTKDRLCLQSPTIRAHPGDRAGDDAALRRVAMLPQLLWPNWYTRLLPATGWRPPTTRAMLAACALLPGTTPARPFDWFTALYPTDTRDEASAPTVREQSSAGSPRPPERQEKPHLRPAMLRSVMKALAPEHRRDVLALLCDLAAGLDAFGGPIDYSRRREQVPVPCLSRRQWRELRAGVAPMRGVATGSADVVGAGADPTDRDLQLPHAQRFLHELLTGDDLTRADHPLTFQDARDHRAYATFCLGLSRQMRAELDRHAAEVLRRLGIEEPLTWAPPLSWATSAPWPEFRDGDHTDERNDDQEGERDLALRIGARAQTTGVSPEVVAVEFGLHVDHVEALLQSMSLSERDPPRDGETASEVRRRLHDLSLQLQKSPGDIVKIATALGVRTRDVRQVLHAHGLWSPAAQIRLRPPLAAQENGSDLPADVRRASRTVWGPLRLARFLCVAEGGSCVSGAVAADASTFTVKQQIRRLEVDLEAPLFTAGDRYGAVRLTGRGERLVAQLRAPEVARWLDLQVAQLGNAGQGCRTCLR